MIRILEPFTGEVVAEHQLVPPGETSIADEHYGSARPDKPLRAPRPGTAAEKQFLALGEPAAAFLAGGRRGRGTQPSPGDRRDPYPAGGAAPRPPGQALVLTLPSVPVRPLSDYAFGGVRTSEHDPAAAGRRPELGGGG